MTLKNAAWQIGIAAAAFLIAGALANNRRVQGIQAQIASL